MQQQQEQNNITPEVPSLKPESIPDAKKRRFFTWLVNLLGSVGVLLAAFPFLSAWRPGAKARAAAAPVTVDLTELTPGEIKKISWRGKPVWVIQRSTVQLGLLHKHLDKLRDPDSKTEQQPPYANNAHRSIKPKYLVLVGVCTHLGCSPSYKPEQGDLGQEWPGGFFCPCHGSTFDLAGRVFKDVPAPINLAVPPHYYKDANTLVIGEHPKEFVS